MPTFVRLGTAARAYTRISKPPPSWGREPLMGRAGFRDRWFCASLSPASYEPPVSALARHFRSQPGAAAAGRHRRRGVSRRLPLVQPAREGVAPGRTARIATAAGRDRTSLPGAGHGPRRHRRGCRRGRRRGASARWQRPVHRPRSPAARADRRLHPFSCRSGGAIGGRRRLRHVEPDFPDRQQTRIRTGGRPRRAGRSRALGCRAGRRARRHRSAQHRRLPCRRRARDRRDGRRHAVRRPRTNRPRSAGRNARRISAILSAAFSRRDGGVTIAQKCVGNRGMDADYLVIGAGSAGCVVASRLSEDGARVVLLEAGPPDRDPWIHIPAGVLRVLNNPRINWNFMSEGEPGTAGRRLQWPRGKTLGGTSSINGMLYVRGNPADYDGWAQRGCRGWSYEEVLPFFRKSETYRGAGDPEYRSRGGPLIVEDYRTILGLTHRFVEAAQQAGFAFTPDYNGKQQEGVAYSLMTRRGRLRGSTARTFLAAARHRANLRIETEAIATRLLFAGRRCTGVAFRQRGTERQLASAREVILCGGAVNSPHLLQISGIGPAAHLQEIGVPVLHDLPGVGANLNDHYVVRVSHRVKNAVTINQLARGLRLAREAVRWAAFGNGALTFGVTSAMVFCRSREGLSSPDLQLLFTPASYARGVFRQLEREPGMTVAVCPVRPESRGTIMAQSPDPLV